MNRLQELFNLCWPNLKGLPASRKKLAEEAYRLGYEQGIKDSQDEIKAAKAGKWEVGTRTQQQLDYARGPSDWVAGVVWICPKIKK